MARNQALQMTINQEEWALAWKIYGQVLQGMALVPAPPTPVSLNPASFGNNQNTFQSMFANFGTYMDQVATALGNDGLRVTLKTAWTAGSAVIDPGKLSDTTPAIVLLGWYDARNKRNGGHFIVASRVVSSGRVVFQDPWQGQLKELGVGPAYPGAHTSCT